MRQQGTLPSTVTALYLQSPTSNTSWRNKQYQNETEMKAMCQAKLLSRSTTWRWGLKYTGKPAQMLQVQEHFPSIPCAKKQESLMKPLWPKNVAVSPKHRDARGFRYLKIPCDPAGITSAWSETSPVPPGSCASIQGPQGNKWEGFQEDLKCQNKGKSCATESLSSLRPLTAVPDSLKCLFRGGSCRVVAVGVL